VLFPISNFSPPPYLLLPHATTGSLSVAWTDSLTLGVPALDKELQGCLDTADQLLQALVGEGNDQVGRTNIALETHRSGCKLA